MPRPRKIARSSSESDDEYAPPASARRPSSIKVKPREQRDRRAPTAFSPTVDTPTRKPRKPKDPSLETDDNSTPATTPVRPEHKRLENRIKSQAHRLRYPLAFIDAYEAEGWNKSSLDKLKPSKELDAERRKIVKGQRALIDGLHELKALYANEPQVPLMAVFEDVHCSRCGSTDIEQDNDILLCDSVGCHRAYHQKCQTPIVLTAKIPAGEESWFCEVCLAVFECLKSINSVFGTTYEDVDDLFPELTQGKQASSDASSTAQSEEESATAPADEDDEEENDDDFVLNDEEESDEDEEDEDEKNEIKTGDEGDGEEMAIEVPESAQDLLYLSKDDVIDVNQRSSRSKSAILPPKPVHKKVSLIGEPAAKIDPKTGEVILGVVAQLEPPAQGRYSRWRIDYRDGSSELLTRSKTQAAINRAAVEDSDDEDGGDFEALLVRGKRKRNEVDYRQLNELMFAGKDEDSEGDETFEVKEGSEEEPDEEEENEDDEGEEDEGKEESAESVLDQSSPTTVTASHAAVSQPSDGKLEPEPVDFHSMHEGLLLP